MGAYSSTLTPEFSGRNMFQRPRALALADVQSDFTAYADYRLPQVLRQLGVLEYDAKLANLIDNQNLFASGSEQEEILRASTVLACELLAENAGVRTTDVDCYLFLKTRDESFMQGIQPFHLVKTTHY